MMTGHRQSMWFWLRSTHGKWSVHGIQTVKEETWLSSFRVQNDCFFFFFSLTEQSLGQVLSREPERMWVQFCVVWSGFTSVFISSELFFVLLCVSSIVGSEPGFESDRRQWRLVALHPLHLFTCRIQFTQLRYVHYTLKVISNRNK